MLEDSRPTPGQCQHHQSQHHHPKRGTPVVTSYLCRGQKNLHDSAAPAVLCELESAALPLNEHGTLTTSKKTLVDVSTAALEAGLAGLDLGDYNQMLEGDDHDNCSESSRRRTTKEKLLFPADVDRQALANVVRMRVEEGHGEALYQLGLEDDGSPVGLSKDGLTTALTVLNEAAMGVGVESSVVLNKVDKQSHFCHVLLRRKPTSAEQILEVRCAVLGNVDAGKSTMLGVLTKGQLDDGRGKARINLFRHKHEFESGRTSSVGLEILGYDAKGQPVLPPSGRKLTWEEICSRAAKVISFIDLAGHERYLKTTVFGMTGCAPDVVILMIGSNAGVIGMAKEHLGLALALSVPVICVITKIDMCPANVLDSTLVQLTKILKSFGCRKIPIFVKSDEDVVTTSANFVSERICPVFQISNVTGEGIPLLRGFLNLLPLFGNYDVNQPVEFQITDTFSVPFVGTVVSGTVFSGVINAGDALWLGPDSTGQFISATVKSIQRKRVDVPFAIAGQSVSFGLKKIRRSMIRKGMVMLGKTTGPTPRACREFEAEVLVLYHSTTISQKYQAMVHCGAIRQTAKIVGLSKQILRTGDRALVHFRFISRSEYLKPGTKMLFREGRTKGVGIVRRCLFGETVSYDSPAGGSTASLLATAKQQSIA